MKLFERYLYHKRPLQFLMIFFIIVCVLLTVIFVTHSYTATHQEKTLNFRLLTEQSKRKFLLRLDSYQLALQGSVGFFQGSTEVTAKEWQTYIHSLNIQPISSLVELSQVGQKNGAQQRSTNQTQEKSSVRPQDKLTDSAELHKGSIENTFPGLYGIGYFPPAQKQTLKSKYFASLNQSFQYNNSEHDSQSKLYQAASLSKKIDAPVLTDDTFKDNNYREGYILFPIYEPNHKFKGWIFAYINMQKMFQALLTEQAQNFFVAVFEKSPFQTNHLVFQSTEKFPLAPDYSTIIKLSLFQKQYTIVWVSTPAFDALNLYWHPIILFCVAAFLISLLVIAFILLITRTKHIENEVQKQTQRIFANEAQFKLLIKNTPAAVAMFDKEMNYIMTSDRWISDYHLEGKKIIGRSHYDIFTEIKKIPRWVQIHQRALRGEVIQQEEDAWIRVNGQVEWVKWAIHPWKNEQGDIGGIVMFTEVITSKKENQIRIEVLRQISTDANEAKNVHQAIQITIEIVAKFLNWPVGHAFWYDKQAKLFRSMDTWYFLKKNKKNIHFQEISDQTTFQTKIGLPGRVHALKSVVFIQDVATDSNFPRNQVLKNLHLHAAIGIPLVIKNEVIAVLEFFDERKIPESQLMIDLFRSIGSSTSRVVERKKIEQALEESNALNHAVLNSTNYIIIATDLNGVVMVFNRTAEELLGYKAKEIIHKQTPILWHNFDEIKAKTLQLNEEFGLNLEPGFETFIYKARLNGLDSGEWTFIRKDGSTFPGLLNATPVHHNNEIMGYLGVIEDITIKKSQQEKLIASEETFRQAMQNAAIGMALVSPEGQWLKVNKSLSKLLGYSEAELKKINFQKITHPEDLQKDLSLIAEILNGKKNMYQLEKRYIHKDGHTIWALLTVSLVRTTGGRPKYFISQMVDMTQQKQVENMKNEFISVISHELRTPLTSIAGSLKMVVATMLQELPPKVQKLLQIAQRNAQRLILLINDILDMDKITTGKMTFHYQNSDIKTLIQQSALMNESYAQQHQVTLRTTLPNEDVFAEIDEDKVNQILANLISNAAKFSPKDSTINITLKIIADKILIAVKDSGTGIPASFQSKIFKKFSQADASLTRKKGGTGLGLYICKQIIEIMHGEIGFDSTPNQGTTFWFTLPIKKP